jgi:hypothetical protein
MEARTRQRPQGSQSLDTFAIAPAEDHRAAGASFHRMGTRSDKHPGTRNSDAEALHQLAECPEGAVCHALAARFANAPKTHLASVRADTAVCQCKSLTLFDSDTSAGVANKFRMAGHLLCRH